MESKNLEAYVYQPLPPQDDGKYFGVGGLEDFGLSYDDSKLQGVSRKDAEEIVRLVNLYPEFAVSFIKGVKSALN